jgi:hypothetical protein
MWNKSVSPNGAMTARRSSDSGRTATAVAISGQLASAMSQLVSCNRRFAR